MFKNLIALLKGQPSHKHDFENWVDQKIMVATKQGEMVVIQTRKCKTCGYVEIHKASTYGFF